MVKKPSFIDAARFKTLVFLVFLAISITTGVSVLLCTRVADGIVARSCDSGLAQMQSGADAVARQTALVLQSLSDIKRLALLTGRLDKLDDSQGTAAALGMLRTAMRESRLGVSELAVFGSHGDERLHVGIPHGPGPEAGHTPGFGPPWLDDTGLSVLRWTTRLDDSGGYLVEISMDQLALSQAEDLVLPPGMLPTSAVVATLARIQDGMVIARSRLGGRHLEDATLIRPATIRDMMTKTFGSERGISRIDGIDRLTAYRVMPALGLIAMASAPTDDMLALARLQAQRWRAAPLAMLAVELGLAGLFLGWAARRRQRAVLADQEQAAATAAAVSTALEDLVRCSPAMLYRGHLDPQGRYSRTYLTPNSKRISGWEPEDLSNADKMWANTMPEDQHLRSTHFLRAHRDGAAAMEFRLSRPDGEVSWLRNEVVVVERHGDGSAEVVGAVTNVTHEHQIAAQAAQLNRMATLGEIATSIAHELSQPLTVISMVGSLAQMQVEEFAAQEIEGAADLAGQIGIILQQGQRAAEIILHLRAYGRSGGGGEMERVDLRLAVSGTLVLAGRPLVEAAVAVEVDLPADLPLVRGRMAQVEQVLLNLLINARDALLAAPAKQRRVRISAEVEAGKVVLHIADSGPGIPAEVMSRLFEPFFTTKPAGEGTGLGLSFCRTMMEGFGGSISVRNADGGAVFSLHFALAMQDGLAME
jgi:PAS domain S-box-containing protein